MPYTETQYEDLDFNSVKYQLREWEGSEPQEKLKLLIELPPNDQGEFNTKDKNGHTFIENLGTHVARQNGTTPDKCDIYELKDDQLIQHTFTNYREGKGDYKNLNEISVFDLQRPENLKNAPREIISTFDHEAKTLNEEDKSRLESELGAPLMPAPTSEPISSTLPTNQTHLESNEFSDEYRKKFLENVASVMESQENDINHDQQQDKKIADSHDI